MKRDPLTTDMFPAPPMFDIPQQASRNYGELALGVQVAHRVAEMLKHSTLSRNEIAARMSELTGDDISKNSLDSWTAQSRVEWRFPLEYLPALEVALESHALTQWIGAIRGCKVMVGREALDAEMGKIKKQQMELARREKALMKILGEDE